MEKSELQEPINAKIVQAHLEKRLCVLKMLKNFCVDELERLQMEEALLVNRASSAAYQEITQSNHELHSNTAEESASSLQEAAIPLQLDDLMTLFDEELSRRE